jgi:hypothetical protein
MPVAYVSGESNGIFLVAKDKLLRTARKMP